MPDIEKISEPIDANEVIKDIENGALDLSFFKNLHDTIKIPANIIISLLTLGLEGWLAYLSSEYFLFYGAKGAELLPLGNREFNKKIAAPACFISNAILTFYLSILTTLQAREEILIYRLKKKHGMPTYPKKMALKLSISLLLATLAAIPFIFLSFVTDSVEDEGATAFDNILLNFIGSHYLQMLTIQLFLDTKNKCMPKNTKSSGIASRKGSINVESSNTETNIEHFSKIFSENLQRLERFPNKEFKYKSIYKLLLKNDNETTPLVESKQNHQITCSTIAKWSGITLTHLSLQFCNVISMISLLLNTIKVTGKELHITNPILKMTVGSFAFSISSALAVKLIWDTADKVIYIFSSLTDKNHKTSFGEKLFLIPKLICIGGQYYIAYISASTMLALNKKFDLNADWITWLTCIAIALFNGFGGMEMSDFGIDLLKEMMLFSKEKRKTLSIGRKADAFFKSLPKETRVQWDNDFSKKAFSS